MADKLQLKFVPPVATTPKAESPEQPSGLRQAGAAVIRTGAPWLATEGGLLGFGVNATGELLAELLEGSMPNLGRIALEGGLGAVPGAAMIKKGKALASAVRGAGIAELGNVGRRFTEKNDITDTYRPITEAMKGNFGELGMDLGTSALGAGVGAIGGKLTTAPEPKASPAPPLAGVAVAEKAEQRLEEFNKLPRKEKDRLLKERANADRVEAEAANTRQAAKDKDAELQRAELEETFNARQEAEAAAKKATEEQLAREKFERTKAGRVPSTAVSETTTAPSVNTAGGKGQVKTSFRVAKPKKGGDVSATPPPAPTAPPTNVVEGEIIPPARLALPPDSRVPGSAEAEATRAARVEAALAAAPPLPPELDVPPPPGRPVFDAQGRVVEPSAPVSSEPLPSSASVSPAGVDPAVEAAMADAQTALGKGKVSKAAVSNPVQAWKDKLATILKMTDEAPPRVEPVTPPLTEAVKGTEPPVVAPVQNAAPAAPVASPVVEPTLPPEVIPDVPLTAPEGPQVGAPGNSPFRSSKTMATDLYRDLRAAQKTGELQSVPGVDPKKQPIRLAGRAAVGQPGTERRVAEDMGEVIGGRRVTDQPPVMPTEPPPAVVPSGPPPPPKGVTQTNAARKAASDPEVRARAAATRVANNLKRRGESGQIDPALMLDILMGGGGALTGAAVNPDDPLTGAVVGGGMGLGARRLGSKLATPEGEAQARNLIAKLPNFQRFSYLSGPSNILANALGGPYGSGTMGSLEQILAEKLGASKGTKDAVGAFKEIANPKAFLNEFWDARDRAGQILRNAQDSERAGSTFTSKPIDWSNPKSIAAHTMEIPATAMAAGDEAVRTVLIKHGFSEAEARRMTLTSEPLWKFSKALMNTTRSVDPGEAGSVAMALLFPFKRTALNILEQGLERTPLVGFAAQAFKKPELRDAWQHAVVQQGLGAAVWLTSEQLGESMDPESAKGFRKFVSNLGGQYSFAASSGFSMGQAARAGKSSAGDLIYEGLRSLVQETPLPSAQVVTDVGKAAKDTLDSGSVVLPNNVNPGVLRDRTPGFSIEDILFGRNLSEKP